MSLKYTWKNKQARIKKIPKLWNILKRIIIYSHLKSGNDAQKDTCMVQTIQKQTQIHTGI